MSTEMVPVDDNKKPDPANSNSQLAKVMGTALGTNAGLYCSVDMRDTRGKFKAAAMIQGETIDALAVNGQPLKITDIMLRPITMLDEKTGEYMDACRTVLACDDGRLIGMVSKGAVNSLAVLIAIFGPPTWSPPLEITIRVIKTRKGFNTFVISPVEGQQPDEPTKKKK